MASVYIIRRTWGEIGGRITIWDEELCVRSGHLDCADPGGRFNVDIGRIHTPHNIAAVMRIYS